MQALTRIIDIPLLVPALLLSGAGLITMNTFGGENFFFERQVLWIILAVSAYAVASSLDMRFLRRPGVLIGLYLGSLFLLVLLLLFGDVVLGAKNRFDLGFFSLQPSDPTQLVLILILAKYFSRRHVEIAHFRHILVSGLYAFLIFALMFLQPDFGSAIIIFMIWFGMVLVSGISKKHLFMVFAAGVAASLVLWFFAFETYQKERIVSFLNPLEDIQGAGYNAYQSMVAVGSGQMLGKGIGLGTQSKLEFLPEYETDFIFAAFAEEWGFVGVTILFGLFAVLIWRILYIGMYGAGNFEMLFAAGYVALIMSHVVIHVGMNIGLLPVTGTTIPFLSYGGSHLIAEFVGLGILTSMRRYGRAVHRHEAEREFLGGA